MSGISTVMKYIRKYFHHKLGKKSFSETNPLPAKAATIWGHFDAAMDVKALASSALDIFFADKYETDFDKATECHSVNGKCSWTWLESFPAAHLMYN